MRAKLRQPGTALAFTLALTLALSPDAALAQGGPNPCAPRAGAPWSSAELARAGRVVRAFFRANYARYLRAITEADAHPRRLLVRPVEGLFPHEEARRCAALRVQPNELPTVGAVASLLSGRAYRYLDVTYSGGGDGEYLFRVMLDARSSAVVFVLPESNFRP